LSQTITCEWFKHFKNGRTLMDDDKRSGWPSTSRFKPQIAQIKNIICRNRRLIVWELAEEVGISNGSCHTNLREVLGMYRVSKKFVPRLLTDDL
jgi:hypothetical protein